MTNFVYANNVSTTLAAATTSAMTTLTLASAINLPATIPTGYVLPLTLNDAATRMIYEIVYVTMITGTTLTVLRAQEGTQAQNWAIGDYAFSAVTMGQMQSLQVSAPAVGDARNLEMSVPAASFTATMTADEIVAKSMLGAPAQILSMFNQTINLATTGAGGMDTGTSPLSGYVALYAIYNPTTGTAALLATNATAILAPSVYGGAYMPAGYTSSALVSVWPTNTTGEFVIGYQAGRAISIVTKNVMTITTIVAAMTALSIATTVPLNAKSVKGWRNATATSAANLSITVASSTTSIGESVMQCVSEATTLAQITGDFELQIITPQEIYYMTYYLSATNPDFVIEVNGYTI
jgi:hypothetical protein